MTESTAATPKAWQGERINGFRIGRYLGGSGHSSVFAAEYDQPHAPAAVKILPVGAEDPALLAQVRQAASLSHPNLLKIVESGYCQLGSTTALYIVMEYAEEDLSLVLPERSLTEDETRQMLRPLLEVLAYLHGIGFVHGALKPSNIMAVGDCLKLSSDTVCRIGTRPAFSVPDLHDAPEVAAGALTPASDAWSLGVTIAEVLTQKFPEWQGSELILPQGLPFPFPQIVRRCLSIDPTQRWNVADISACLPIGATGQPGAVHARNGRGFDFQKWKYPAIGAAGLVVVAGLLLLPSGTPKSQQNTTVETPTTPARAVSSEAKPSAEQLATASLPAEAREAPTPSVVDSVTDEPGAPLERHAVPVEKPAIRSTPAGGSVAQQVLPEVPQKAMDTITGKLRNSVRVTVDPSGDVSDARMESQGPSRYFANFSLKAARDWKFTPGESAGDWIVSFEYRSDTVTAKAAPSR